MRILVADQNALLLAAITATFGKHCDLVTATRRDMCIAYVEQEKFDVVVACDKMADYTGLELLSEVAALSPGTLLIFAASAERLERLSYRLQVFGLLDTLAYPITPRKLLNALRKAREHLPARAARKIPHVVLESEWDTGERLALVENDLDAAVARHSSGIGESDWINGPLAKRSAPTERAHGRGGADAGSLGDGGVEEFVFAALPYPGQRDDWIEAMAEDLATEVPAAEVAVAQVPVTQHQRWEVSERQGFVYETAAVAAIEVMPAEVPVAYAKDSLEQVDYEEVGNDPAFDVPEPLSWGEDGAANDIVFGGEPGGLDPVDGQTLSATLTSGGAWSVSPAWSLSPHPALASPESQPPDGSSTSSGELMRQGDSAASPSGPIQEVSSPTSAAAEKTAAHPAEKCAGATPATKHLPQPRERAPSVPTAAQRAAFERALARRNAERKGIQTDPASNVSGRARKKSSAATNQNAGMRAVSSMLVGPGSGESKSLRDLARMAINKRPLTAALSGKTVPKRAVFAVGSGLAAVILVGVLCFELVRPDHSAVAHQRPTEVTSSQFFSPATTVLESQGGGGAAQLVPPSPSPAVPQGEAAPAPVPQNFDPNTAPPDPPPPPPLEQPGPMEPPPPPWARPLEPPDPMSGGGTEPEN